MNKLAIGSLAVFILTSALAWGDAAPITAEQAMADQGQNVTVEGVAHVSRADGMPGVFVHVSDRPPFVGYISDDNEALFPDLRALNGKTVDITGIVEIQGGVPMIRLSTADQVRIVR